MASGSSRRRAPRGNITWLPSGAARVSVYAGLDQLTGKEIRLRATVPARDTHRETEREAEKVKTRLLNQVDEERSPRTEASVNELLDRWLEVIDVERKTRVGYVGKIEKHIRPTLGRLAVGKVKVEIVEGLYGQLRRCRDHCRGRKYVQHRTTHEHACDEHTARRKCAKEVSGDPGAECRWCDRACGPHRRGRAPPPTGRPEGCHTDGGAASGTVCLHPHRRRGLAAHARSTVERARSPIFLPQRT